MSRIEIRVPDMGGMKSEKIRFAAWLKTVGESVTLDEDLFEVELDKANVVCEAQAEGKLAEITVSDGEVHTGDVIGYLDA
ncbi:lipoyl domain-containing protein [bacterium]|nr:lipoyl domain-containing protein [bacterium]